MAYGCWMTALAGSPIPKGVLRASGIKKCQPTVSDRWHLVLHDVDNFSSGEEKLFVIRPNLEGPISQTHFNRNIARVRGDAG